VANEIQLSISFGYTNPALLSQPVGRGASGYLADSLLGVGPAGPQGLTVQTTATVVPLGSVTEPYYAWFCNLDDTNYVQLQNGAAGAVFARLQPGDCALVPLDPGCVPYAVANTAAVQLEYLIVSR